MRATLLAGALAAQLAGAAPARACGVCVEDKMAAVYDHAMVLTALGQKHHVAFFHIDGSLVTGDSTKQALLKIAGSAAAADKGGVRVSVESASLAVAFDPQRTSVAALQNDLERRLAARKFSLMLLQVLARPADVNSSLARALRARGT